MNSVYTISGIIVSNTLPDFCVFVLACPSDAFIFCFLFLQFNHCSSQLIRCADHLLWRVLHHQRYHVLAVEADSRGAKSSIVEVVWFLHCNYVLWQLSERYNVAGIHRLVP